jgi:hypothetical protein
MPWNYPETPARAGALSDAAQDTLKHTKAGEDSLSGHAAILDDPMGYSPCRPAPANR